MSDDKIRRGLVAFIKATGLSDQQFSQKMGVCRSTVWRWKNDTKPGIDIVVAIADKFSTSVDAVIGRRV